MVGLHHRHGWIRRRHHHLDELKWPTWPTSSSLDESNGTIMGPCIIVVMIIIIILVRASRSLCGLTSSSDERIEHGLGLTQLVNCTFLLALLGLLWGATWLGILWVARPGPLLLSNKPNGPIWGQANQLANWWVESWPGYSPFRAHREGLGGPAYCGPW